MPLTVEAAALHRRPSGRGPPRAAARRPRAARPTMTRRGLRRLGGGDRDAAADDRRLLGGDRRRACRRARAWWSRSMRASTATAGVPTVVASRRPPRPTSSTATSTRLAREVIEGQRGGRLEHRWRRARATRVPSASTPSTTRVLGDRLAVDADALAERDEVRRGVEADAAAGGASAWRRASPPPSPCRWCRRPGPACSALRMAERVQQRLDALEARAHPRVLAAPQGEEPGHRLGVRHAGSAWAAGRRRRRGGGGACP